MVSLRKFVQLTVALLITLNHVIVAKPSVVGKLVALCCILIIFFNLWFFFKKHESESTTLFI